MTIMATPMRAKSATEFCPPTHITIITADCILWTTATATGWTIATIALVILVWCHIMVQWLQNTVQTAVATLIISRILSTSSTTVQPTIPQADSFIPTPTMTQISGCVQQAMTTTSGIT